ncbi:MAG: iron-containing alcohol dehydrogenase, partial [Armatimonadetes bacterium]|nr:iron-containing alcohol dehydrogenase [Candidatus Hippobium faecium]
MLGNIEFHNPTHLYFGENSLENLKKELPKYGKNILLSYGGGSIKKNGVYDKVIAILNECGKTVTEDPGVMPNPTTHKVYEGCERARACNADLILAVGGGSCCDYAKTVSISAWCDGDFWEKYFINGEDVSCRTIPVACVLTMPGTGSEMNIGAVITNPEKKLKYGYYTQVYPDFSILDPVFTYSLPKYQMVSGVYDIMSHIMESYFSGTDDNTTDYISEGLMRSLIHSSKIAVVNQEDYEARSNIMWTATWALNYLLSCGKPGDWEVHMIGQAISGVTDATHGMTLSAVQMPYFRIIMPYAMDKFVRFAKNVWDVRPEGKTDKEIAEEGLSEMEKWMKEIGLCMNVTELGITEENIPDVIKGCFYNDTGYKQLTEAEVVQILK